MDGVLNVMSRFLKESLSKKHYTLFNHKCLIMAKKIDKPQKPALRKTAVMRGFSLNKLVSAKKKYDEEIESVYKELKPYVKFDFFVMHQQGDGFVIVDNDNSHNARLSKCIMAIERDGFLDYDNYLPECI